jgi:hypothetical protein
MRYPVHALLAVTMATVTLRAQTDALLTIETVVERMNKAESAVLARVRAYRPIAEIYIQTLAPDTKLGTVPTRDDYFLGQFEGSVGPSLTPLSTREGSFRPAGILSRPLSVTYMPNGFAATTVPDWNLLDAERYAFSFVRREFLGEARTLVFDVHPRSDRDGGFTGRIWVEDRDYNIVRFNGISRNVDHNLSGFFWKKISFHVDSWRVNVLPGQWLPAYVYCEETDPSDNATALRAPRIKAQVRLWAYQIKGTSEPSEFSRILVDEPTVQDNAEPPKQLSPVQSQRRWEQQAEENVIDRLSRAGLLAPRGRVDEVLETVINNLIVTNNLALETPVHARVLLTQPLESFTVGHSIVVSRGLIDVLPDEASLAMVLGHELSHIVLGHPVIDTKFAFADRLMIPDGELLKTLRFRHAQAEEKAADAKVLELLGSSPYKDKLADAGLFLRAVAANAKALTNLIQPHMGDFIVEGGQPLAPIIFKAPELAPERLDQIAALPLGARVVVDPWSNKVDLLRAPSVALASAREKVPLAITPLMPYLRYAEPPVRAALPQR